MSADRIRYPRITYVDDSMSELGSRFVDTIERLSGRKKLEAVYHQIKGEGLDDERFFSRALELADIQYHVHRSKNGCTFPEGPLVLVANHPFGVIDGLILCDIASRMHKRFAILVNALLCRDPELNGFFLPIDFADTKQALAKNISSKRAALEILKAGGVVLVFPSGGISTRSRGGMGPLKDLPWTTFTAKLIARTGATVVPYYFHGCNSRLFQVASNLHPSLRASLLLHEARNKMGRKFHVSEGEPICYPDVEHLNRQALTSHIYQVTTRLGVSPIKSTAITEDALVGA
ncbi:MAG: lysophospholipid acyltransferase family protein [Pseudomonadota bacterium]